MSQKKRTQEKPGRRGERDASPSPLWFEKWEEPMVSFSREATTSLPPHLSVSFSREATGSHNGHSGWHLVACFTTEEKTGNIRFVHVMLAVLNGHNLPEPDWVYVGSKVNVDTGSRRTETYNTTLIGTTKLRDGSVYLDPTAINFKRWRQGRRGPVPPFSIFAQP
jgi:hypothetical protein